MKKALFLSMMSIIIVLVMTVYGCGAKGGKSCNHDFKDATCDNPKTCEKCGETEGKAIEHDFKPATCTEPETCTRCSEIKGEAKGHRFNDATCAAPRTCEECGATDGEPLEHEYNDAICTTGKKCKNCGDEIGEALGHDYAPATIHEPSTCKLCGDTVGEKLEALSANYTVLTSGYMENDYYELVSKQNDSLNGSTIELGLIKNNQWQIPLNSDWPFLNEEKWWEYFTSADEFEFEFNPNGYIIYTYDCEESLTDEYGSMVIYNVKNGVNFKVYRKSYLCGWLSDEKREELLTYDFFINDSKFVARDRNNHGRLSLFDLATGTVTPIETETNDLYIEVMAPMREGLFLACVEGYYNQYGFYNIKGERVIDLTSYFEYFGGEYGTGCFEDGEYTFVCNNGKDVYFQVTIDKTGKILKEEKVER